MTAKPGKAASLRPQVFTTLLAFLCLCGGSAGFGQSAVDRTQAGAVAYYVVQPGDILAVLIWGWPSASDKLEGRFPIVSNGRVYLPVIGSVAVAGKTVEQVQTDLRQR